MTKPIPTPTTCPVCRCKKQPWELTLMMTPELVEKGFPEGACRLSTFICPVCEAHPVEQND